MTTRGASSFARVGPVHFQSLEQELQPVAAHVAGRVLNAGCGERDITALLQALGATEVVNYDIETSIPGAVQGSLTDISLPSDSFDTIICNAVLEHVPQIGKVMSELVRVLKPGGRLIVGMPFLQPYHLCPTDFRRYTRDGLVELGEEHGLETVALLPVHGIAQTLGWIAWEWAQEKGRMHRALVYPVVWLATRIWHRTDPGVVNNANTYQVVYAKPGGPTAGAS